jgi:hypothetical protein
MGIDIGFTDESLRNCKYALCRPYKRNVVAIYSEPPEQGDDSLAQYRQIDKVVNMASLEQQEPQLYQELTKDEPLFAKRDIWHWNKGWFKDFYTDRRKASRIEPYIKSSPSSRVWLKGMPKELAQEWVDKVGERNWLSAWYAFSFERREQICKPCPVRPLDETNCYIRFSNYPGMNSFKQGFMVTLLYSTTIDEKKVSEALFSFPHLDRQKGQLPKDKLGELIEMCEGTPIDKGAEHFFNSVVDTLEKVKPLELESDTGKIDMVDIPFIDEFISKYIYREEPYSIEETKRLLPYVETLQEVAEWAIWDADNKAIRARIIGFKNRFDSLVTALHIADKYGLEVRMSY